MSVKLKICEEKKKNCEEKKEKPPMKGANYQ